MSTKYANADIYNRDGVLLYAKGQELTEEVVLKLHSLDIIERPEPDSFKDEIKIFNCTKSIKNKFINLDDLLLKDSTKILSEVIFSSKSSPWWMSVNALSNYVDWLYTHSIDVALISLIIAIKLDYNKAKQKQLCLGALLHDIGKLLIPRNIIQKPGKLNDQEMTLMKQHCELGYGMIKELNLPKECTDVILQHHERLDGSGYPYGLKNNQISDNAKIVMIADVLDAITSYRPYKSVKEFNAALTELKNQETRFEKSYVLILADYLQV
jgi:putative nucleotidyltransferase with HDIG domain